MSLHDYLLILRKRWRIVAAAVISVLAIAALVTFLTPKTYSAGTRLFVSTSGSDNTSLLQGGNFTQQRVKSYADIITTPTVLDPVIAKLELPTTAHALGRQIAASVPLDTVLIDVTVTQHDPKLAADIANAVSQRFTRTVADLESMDGKASPVKVTVVSTAAVPKDPISPNPVRNGALALVLGLLAGLGLAVLRDAMDTRIYSERDISEVADAVVIGTIRYDAEADARPLLIQGGSRDSRAEGFRMLRTNLQFIDAADHPKSMLIASSIPGEGKTTTAVNLAVTMAAGGARVCVIEGDLRRPRMLEYMGLEGSVGLTNVLIGNVRLDDVLQPFANTTVTALGAGAVPPNPSELLGSAAMRHIVAELVTRFDHVIIDAPPLLPVTDAAVLSTVTDGTILVVGSGMVKREQLLKSLSSLDAVQGHILGVVLNKVPVAPGDNYGYYAEAAARASSRKTSSGRAKHSRRSAVRPAS